MLFLELKVSSARLFINLSCRVANDYPPIMMVMSLAVLIAVLQLVSHVAADEKCKVDDRVKFLLKNMNADTVKLEVDCVTGVGQCDELGNQLKLHARDAVHSGKCGASCSCEEINARLVVNKLKKDYASQWQRVERHFARK